MQGFKWPVWSAFAALAFLVTPAFAAPGKVDREAAISQAWNKDSIARRVGVRGEARVKARPSFEDPRVTGDRLLAAGERAAALAAYESAARLHPQDLRVWRVIGDLHFVLDRPAEAVRAWVRGLELDPQNTDLLERVARGALQVGDFPLAAQAEGRLVNRLAADLGGGINADLQRHLVLWSELAVMAGDYTTGEEAARRLIALAPHRIEGRLALAYVHLQAMELDEAEPLYREVLAIAPDSTIALNNLGNIQYMHRDLDAARSLFERILGVEGVSLYSESIALSNLAELEQLRGAHRNAFDLYQAAIEADPKGAWSYMGLAALFDLTGDYDKAVDVMIDGWERDQNRLTRLNMHFFQKEWYWQRDALIAEIEGEIDLARELWTRVLDGDVPTLHKPAAYHLRALDTLDE